MRSPQKLNFKKADDVPNSHLPVVIFRGRLARFRPRKAQAFRRAFEKSGWVGVWTDTIFDYTHFHSNAHEVLGIAEGTVTLRLGGEKGRLVRLKPGDMLVLPAGVGHRRVAGDDRLKVVGAYPRGQAHFDMKRAGRAIPKPPLPRTDPFEGENGPLTKIWHPRTGPTECGHVHTAGRHLAKLSLANPGHW